jgi:K+-sensing histidine kinase KdpD
MTLKLWTKHVFIGLLATAVALCARWALDPWLGDKYPYALALLIIAFVAWHFGARPATFMVLLFYPIANYVFVSPRGVFLFDDAREDMAGF